MWSVFSLSWCSHSNTCAYVCVCVYVCICLPPWLYLCACECVLLYPCPCACMCVLMHGCTHVYFTSLYIRVPLHAYVRQRVRICLCVCMHVYVSDVQQVRRGRRSCWHARSISHVRKDRPMRTAQPPRTVAASLPSFTLSASTCSVPFWWV